MIFKDILFFENNYYLLLCPAGGRSLVQFLELLSSQRLFEQGKFYCFGNKFYDQDDAITLMPHVPHILKKGLQKNVRFVGDSVADATPILQIDRKKAVNAEYRINYLINFQ
jgi:hypothetical protein